MEKQVHSVLENFSSLVLETVSTCKVAQWNLGVSNEGDVEIIMMMKDGERIVARRVLLL